MIDKELQDKIVEMLKSQDNEMHNLAIEFFFSAEPSMMDYVSLKNSFERELMKPSWVNASAYPGFYTLNKIKDQLWSRL